MIIWFSSGFINLIIFRLFSDANIVLFNFIYFFASPLALFATMHWIGLGNSLRNIKSDFRNKPISDKEIAKRQKRHGRSAIWVSITIFFLVGVITSFWSKSYSTHLLFCMFIGLLWGILWRYLIRKEYFTSDSFDGEY